MHREGDPRVCPLDRSTTLSLLGHRVWTGVHETPEQPCLEKERPGSQRSEGQALGDQASGEQVTSDQLVKKAALSWEAGPRPGCPTVIA